MEIRGIESDNHVGDMGFSMYKKDADAGYYPAQVIVDLVENKGYTPHAAHIAVKYIMAEAAKNVGHEEMAKQIAAKADLERAYYLSIDRLVLPQKG